jgi:hypothetical protein
MKRKSKSSQRLIVPTEQLLNQLNRFKPLLSVGEFEELLEELKNPLLPTIRVNLLKTKPGFIQSMDGPIQRFLFVQPGFGLSPIQVLP